MPFSRPVSTRASLLAAATLVVLGSAYALGPPGVSTSATRRVTISIVGTSDLHGAVWERDGQGGVALLGGYVRNLRARRAADGGAVLLLDAGDTYQGGIESNLSEGLLVVDAYNALGYAAAAIGNHEFDFGALDAPRADDDRRGALKQIAAHARFPVLAANLIDSGTGRPVEWPNVTPSALIDAAGVKVGVIGVMTHDALRKTLVANTRGLHVAPLAPAISTEAARLRTRGATVVVAAAHAGGRCDQWQQPSDVTSCDSQSEIFQVARALPEGLVDVIVAGHAHAGLAHTVNGIAIIESYSGGRAFGRVDLQVDIDDRRTRTLQIFPPRLVCARQEPQTGACASSTAGAPVAEYEGLPVASDDTVSRAMMPALERVRQAQNVPLGLDVPAPVRRSHDGSSPLGNLFAEAIRWAVPEADVAIFNGRTRGGLRADFPAGPLTVGRVYDAFPFDNQIVRLYLTADQLMASLAQSVAQGRSGELGIAGFHLRAACRSVATGRPIVVATTEALAAGPLFAGATTPRPRVEATDFLVRNVVVDWLSRRQGPLRENSFENRWMLDRSLSSCRVS